MTNFQTPTSRETLRSIMRIAVPAIVSNISVPLLSLVDTAITGHLGSRVYLGAIAVGGMIFNVLYWLMGFLRMGTSGLTAQAFGRKDSRDMALQFSRALFLALGIGLLFVALSPWLCRAVFAFVDCPADVEAPAVTYFRICILGAPAVLGIYAFSGWFLGMQNSVAPMCVAIVQNVANLVASLLFVYALQWKVEGVAAGTVAGEYVGFALCFVIFRAKYHAALPGVELTEIMNRAAFTKFFNVNRDIFLRTLLHVAVMSWFTISGARMDATILAANALLIQLFVIFSYISDGIAFSAEALSGRYIGAGNLGAFRKMMNVVGAMCAVAAAMFALAYAAGGAGFLSLLTDDGATVAAAVKYLPFAVAIPLVSVAAFLLDGVFVGATASRYMLLSAILSAAVFFGLFFALRDGMGNYALWTAFISFLFMRSLAMAIFFRPMVAKAFGTAGK